MNAEQEDAQRGRMLRQLQDARRTLGCVQGLLDEHQKTFALAGHACKPSSDPVWDIDGTTVNFLEEPGAKHPYILPEPVEFAKLLKQRETLRADIQRLTLNLGLG